MENEVRPSQNSRLQSNQDVGAVEHSEIEKAEDGIYLVVSGEFVAIQTLIVQDRA